MIPTLILFGLIFGRWPRSSILIGTIGWPIALLINNTISAGTLILGAAGLALINSGVGVLIHQVVLRLIRRLRRGSQI